MWSPGVHHMRDMCLTDPVQVIVGSLTLPVSMCVINLFVFWGLVL